jgi:hypothetical protein
VPLICAVRCRDVPLSVILPALAPAGMPDSDGACRAVPRTCERPPSNHRSLALGSTTLRVPVIRPPLCDLGLFVQEAAEPLSSGDRDVGVDGGRKRPEWAGLVQGPVGPVRVEMGLVLGEDVTQMVCVHDEDPVQDLPAAGPPGPGRTPSSPAGNACAPSPRPPDQQEHTRDDPGRSNRRPLAARGTAALPSASAGQAHHSPH